ncbi:MAG: hypothetical protein ACFE8L_06490 [Candidatus Hodarchaeota archaeon]
MSSGRINNKRIESVKESYKIKELISLDKKEDHLKRQFKDNSHNQLNEELINDIDENFDIIKSLHLILLNCSSLSKEQKFDFCNSQRYFMKLYLKEILKKT